MKYIFIFLVQLFVWNFTFAQEVKTINKVELAALLNSKSDTLYILNFWATWCKPCVEELPIFEQINSEYQGKKVKVILLSNDFKKQVEPKLKPFLVSKKINSEVWWMSETDPNVWVNLVEPLWEGSLPATLIFRGSDNKRFFNEGELNLATLKAIIDKIQP